MPRPVSLLRDNWSVADEQSHYLYTILEDNSIINGLIISFMHACAKREQSILNGALHVIYQPLIHVSAVNAFNKKEDASIKSALVSCLERFQSGFLSSGLVNLFPVFWSTLYPLITCKVVQGELPTIGLHFTAAIGLCGMLICFGFIL